MFLWLLCVLVSRSAPLVFCCTPTLVYSNSVTKLDSLENWSTVYNNDSLIMCSCLEYSSVVKNRKVLAEAETWQCCKVSWPENTFVADVLRFETPYAVVYICIALLLRQYDVSTTDETLCTAIPLTCHLVTVCVVFLYENVYLCVVKGRCLSLKYTGSL